MQKSKSTIDKNRNAEWVLPNEADAEALRSLSDYPPVIRSLLVNRGITDVESAKLFLRPDYARDLHDPRQLRDLPQATRAILAAIEQGKRVVVHGDYDADGLTATALLTTTLRELGATCDTFIPDRYIDGYGLTTSNLRKLRDIGADLVVTVDCGIANASEISAAKKFSLPVIVTDHHEPPDKLPDAVAVINPKRAGDQYPNKDLAGVGVAFTLARALLAESELVPQRREAIEKWLLDLVAIGTVADLVPLTGENRALVSFGLTVLRKTTRPGIRAMIERAGSTPETLSAGSVGFALAPRLNAAGRLGDAAQALKLLMTDDRAEALELAGLLEAHNLERRALTEAALTEAEQKLGPVSDSDPILVVDGEWQSGIVGLVAGRLSQTYGRPAIVLGRSGDALVGSARSIPAFHITNALRANAHFLEQFGGHAQAAGLTVAPGRYSEFRKALLAFAGTRLEAADFTPRITVDAALDPDDLTETLCDFLDQFEPHGTGNPRPRLLLCGATVTQVRSVGQDSVHLKLTLSLPDGRTLEAIGFGLGDRLDEVSPGRQIDVLGGPAVNTFNGRRRLEWRIDDFRGA